jgi:hypothetical protein
MVGERARGAGVERDRVCLQDSQIPPKKDQLGIDLHGYLVFSRGYILRELCAVELTWKANGSPTERQVGLVRTAVKIYNDKGNWRAWEHIRSLGKWQKQYIAGKSGTKRTHSVFPSALAVETFRSTSENRIVRINTLYSEYPYSLIISRW